MRIQGIGYLGYKLYSLGWRSALHGTRHPIDHWLQPL